MRLLPRTLVPAMVAFAAAGLMAQPDHIPSRGELLYDNHCIECHNTQMHWRELKQARDWASLKAQVARWQEIGQLSWSDSEVEAVTGYLNQTIYHFEAPADRLGFRTN